MTDVARGRHGRHGRVAARPSARPASEPASKSSARPSPRVRLRGTALVATLALGLMLAVKIEFRSTSSNDVFYAYGVTVTAVIFITMTISLLCYRDPAVTARAQLTARYRAAGQADSLPLVSCIVAVHNEERLVEQCIAAMAAQTYDRKEIIVVDDASTDGTASILRELSRKYPFRLIELPVNQGKKGALATALLESTGSVIAFADSDTVWESDALELTVPIFQADPDVGGVSGHVRLLNADQNFLTKIQDTWYEGQFSVRKAFESVFGAVTCVSGPLALFRRSAIFNFMPAWQADTFLGQEFRFATDRTLTAYVLGGSYFAPRVLPRYGQTAFSEPAYPAMDWKIVYSKSSRACTQAPSTLRGMIRQQVRWKKSFIRNVFVTGRFYWRRPFLPALLYYVHCLFVILGPFLAIRHLIYLPLRGNIMSAVLYLAGIACIGFAFGLAFLHENPGSRRWLYRPAMSLMSTLILSSLIFYSAATIKKMTWSRG
jgi:cellulose synthase/poly-beta-1,6-N-acetylglucosamine synthase-like glycosyltransferase